MHYLARLAVYFLPPRPVKGRAESRGRPAAETVGAHLRQARSARSLSLADVAQATGISASFLSLVEKDKSDITIGRLVRLIDFYGISISDILPGAVSSGYPQVVRRRSGGCSTRRRKASTSTC